MLFIDLLKKVNIDDVLDYLSRSEAHYRENYLQFYNNLLKREVKVTNDVRIIVALLKDYLEDDSDFDYVYVGGYCDADGKTYSLLFTDWSEWLGYEVVSKSVEIFGETIFVAECLKSMTEIGFEEETITSEKEEMNRRVESIENGTAEFISSEDFFARLSEETGVEYNPDDYVLSDEEKQRIQDNIDYNQKVIMALVKG